MLVRAAVTSPIDRLLDPSCGDGRFLACHGNSVGVEWDQEAAGLARRRAPGAQVYHDEFFAWAQRAARTGERFDAVVGNPPFIRYQTFNGAVRTRALALCAALGVTFSALSASWAPFLVVAASLLRPGGRAAFVVPAAIGHAPAAGPLLEYLVSRFREVRIVAIRRKLFPRLSEDCWLLFASGFGTPTSAIGFDAVDSIPLGKLPCPPTTRVDVAEWRGAWRRRLRPFLLGARARTLYLAAAATADRSRLTAGVGDARRVGDAAVRLGDLATVGLGYVSGANGFFHLTPTRTAKLGIPDALLQTTVRSARVLPNRVLTTAAINAWRRNDQPMLLLRIPKAAAVPAGVQRYLDSAAGQRTRQAYKCRRRRPWYSIPDVRVPDYFLSYMAGRAPNLVRNGAGASCTNALHGVHLRTAYSQKDLLNAWRSPLTGLSCELEGHALGGGMLKLELTEAARVILPQPSAQPTGRGELEEMEEAARTLRRWRHYGE